MADHIYLDGSQPYHRHEGENGVFREVCTAAGVERPAHPVHVFDADALTAHDAAVRQEALAGEGDPPTHDTDLWEWAVGEPAGVGEEAHTARVLAGWDADGVFHCYTTPERLVAAFRDYVEAEAQR